MRRTGQRGIGLKIRVGGRQEPDFSDQSLGSVRRTGHRRRPALAVGRFRHRLGGRIAGPFFADDTTVKQATCTALVRLAAALTLGSGLGGAARAAAPEWPVAGRQGIIRLVIVPGAQAGDRVAYDRQIDALCAGQETCFINFFTNSTGVAVQVPLPDAIANEPTALLRRSAKQGVDSFRWSCRLKKPGDCF